MVMMMWGFLWNLSGKVPVFEGFGDGKKSFKSAVSTIKALELSRLEDFLG